MATAERVILWRMRRPEDGGELVCSVRGDDSGLLHLSLVFDGRELPTLARATRLLAGVMRFADDTRDNLRAGGWHDCGADFTQSRGGFGCTS